jgi:hypothetical protein
MFMFMSCSELSVSLEAVILNKKQDQQIDSVYLYLSKYGQHVNIDIPAGLDRSLFSLVELPENMCRLKNFTARDVGLQLQPGYGCQGMLHAGMPLQQLCLASCDLLDGD